MENHYNCIYMYINKINGKRYIGQTKNFNRRHKQHIKKSSNKYPIDRSLKKYGEENFDVIILKENLSTQCLLNLWESYYIEKYNCLSKDNYNISSGGSNGNNFAGKTEEEMNDIKIKIGIKSKEMWQNKTEEELRQWKQKISELNSGKIRTDETKRRMSESKNNMTDKEKEEWKHKISETKNRKSYEEKKETRRKQSEAKKGKYNGENNPNYNNHKLAGENNPMYGKCSEERRKNISKARSTSLIDKIDKKTNKIIETKYLFEFGDDGFNRGHVVDCCKGNRKSHKGFIFKYHKNTTE